MKAKLPLSVVFSGAVFALLGAFSAFDSGSPTEYGATVGGAFGIFIGCVFGGARGNWIEYVYGPAASRSRGG
jgi:hypothetical protein